MYYFWIYYFSFVLAQIVWHQFTLSHTISERISNLSHNVDRLPVNQMYLQWCQIRSDIGLNWHQRQIWYFLSTISHFIFILENPMSQTEQKADLKKLQISGQIRHPCIICLSIMCHWFVILEIKYEYRIHSQKFMALVYQNWCWAGSYNHTDNNTLINYSPPTTALGERESCPSKRNQGK